MSMSCVLIVEDSEIDQFLHKSMIEDYNSDIEILMASDGQEALEVLEAADKVPDLIFLDINMPRMNGHEFLEAYCGGNCEGPDPDKAAVVVMLTSSSQTRDKEKGEAYDCVKQYMQKPLTLELVAEASQHI